MALISGTRLGPYEILSPIGAGGMGEVYKAKDTRLDRTVAIKVLPEHLAESPERKARFEREAKAISQLNHPHICTLHDVGEQDGVDYLVMEYIEGETLAQRLTKGPLPLEQALEYGAQIADGLDTAHRAGIVHRDLKPANMMLTKSGVKLLDFGLARFVEGDVDLVSSDAPTQQKDLTKDESIIGTLQYMAPEQLERKPADARTDIFALGVVLYEMITGNRAFEGKSQASLIGAILKDDPPPLSSFSPISPAVLDHVVATCLAKDSDQRWQSAGDVERQLKWIAKAGALTSTSPTRERGRSAWVTHAATGVVVALVSALAVWSLRSPEIPRPARFIIDPPPDGFALTNDPNIAISPDGSRIVFGGDDGRLYLRHVDQFEASPLPDTELAHSPFFSPDGEWVGFFSDQDRTLRKIRVGGGPSTTICQAFGTHLGATWGEDDTIIFSSLDAGLARVSASGGIPESLTKPEAETVHGFPEILPGGGVVFEIRDGRGGAQNARLAWLPTGADEPRILTGIGTGPHYSDSGHLLYGDSGRIMAVAFDPIRGEILGSATQVVSDVVATADGPLVFALSQEGTLLYLPGSGTFSVLGELVWIDRQGRRQLAVEGHRGYEHPRLSPDGRRLLVEIERDLWTYDIERGTRSRLIFNEYAADAVWTRDGRRVVYSPSGVGGALFWRSADGSGQAELLLETGSALSAHSWTPDGKVLAYYDASDGDRDIWTVSLVGEREPQPFVVTDFNERSPSFSPDGRWVAYASDESGQDEIYLRPYPGPGGKVTVSTAGGREPVWCPAGGELFYRSGDRMVAVPVETGEVLEVGAPYTLFEGEYITDRGARSGSQSYDVAPDCERFLMISATESAITSLRVVLNWTEELKQIVPADN